MRTVVIVLGSLLCGGVVGAVVAIYWIGRGMFRNL